MYDVFRLYHSPLPLSVPLSPPWLIRVPPTGRYNKYGIRAGTAPQRALIVNNECQTDWLTLPTRTSLTENTKTYSYQ